MKPALFSVGYAGLWGQARLTVTDFIARASRLGYGSVMLMGKRPHLSPLEATPDFLESIRSALRESNVTCDAIAAYTDLAARSPAGVPSIEFQIGYVQSLAQIARQLGAGIVRIFTAYESDGIDLQAQWEQAVIAVREMCDRAATVDVTIAIQNHHDLAIHTDALLEFLSDVNKPNCKLGFDAWSPALRGEDLYESARRAAPHAAITTNADYIRSPRYRYVPELVNYERRSPDWVRAVPFGTGFIDFGAFFRGLRDGGFKGLATYEMCSPLRGGGSLENLDAHATRFLGWWREFTGGR